MVANITTTASLPAFMPNYWDAVLGENLYPNLYFYQFGTKRTVPRNFGTSIKVPRLLKKNIVAEVVTASQGKVIPLCTISSQFISGSLRQFAGAYKHSDILIFTALSDVIDLSLRDISRDIAKKMDTTIRDALSGTGGFTTGGAVATSDLIGSAGILKPAQIIRSVVTLDANNNARPPDNHYPVIINPFAAYDLQSNTSGGAWLDVTKYQETGIGRTYLGEIGRLYGARFVTSTNIRNNIAFSAATSGSRAYMFAPDSFYVTEISDLTARTYIKQLGSGGTADPVNQQATVGAKVYFGVLPATWSSTEKRMIRLYHNTTYKS